MNAPTDDRPADSASLLSVAEGLLRTLAAADPQVPVARNYELSALTLAAIYQGFTHAAAPVKQVIIAAYLLGHTDASAEVARLRAEGVRIGDRNVLMAMELQTIAEAAEEELGEWLPVVIERLPEAMRFARNVLDWATEALEGEPRPSAAVGVAPGEPAKACPSLSVTAADARTS